jgi:cytochrome P450 family 33
LIHHPEVEQKAHEELDRVIGSDRLITLGDKINLPYINAIIMETQRIANLVPINLFHRVTKDVTIEGYLLKKGTWISPQVSCLLYDPEVSFFLLSSILYILV